MQIVMKSRSRTNLSEKITAVLETDIETEINKIEKNYTFLATVGQQHLLLDYLVQYGG